MSETRWAIYNTETKIFEDPPGAVLTFATEGAANRSLSYFVASERAGCQVVQVTVPVEAAPAPDDTADWPWWWMQWDEDDGVKVLASSGPTKRNHWYQVHNGKIWNATLRTQYPIKPTDEEAVRLIEEACGVELPKPEVARWWWWDGKEWKGSRIYNLGIWRHPYGRWNVRVFGTTADRDAKRDALIAAAEAAGEPEVES